MLDRALLKILPLFFVWGIIHSSQSNFWNTFSEDPSNVAITEFTPLDFTIINSSNVWGETEPCG